MSRSNGFLLAAVKQTTKAKQEKSPATKAQGDKQTKGSAKPKQ